MAWCCLASASEEHGHLTLDVSEPILAEDGHNSPIREAIQGVLEVGFINELAEPVWHCPVKYPLCLDVPVRCCAAPSIMFRLYLLAYPFIMSGLYVLYVD